MQPDMYFCEAYLIFARAPVESFKAGQPSFQTIGTTRILYLVDSHKTHTADLMSQRRQQLWD